MTQIVKSSDTFPLGKQNIDTDKTSIFTLSHSMDLTFTPSMTAPTMDMAPVGQNQSCIPDKTFTKVANEYFLTPVLNSPTLDQRVIISSLLSNSSFSMWAILSKILIDELFSTN